MSLINDALKRTQEAQQQQAPAASGTELKPVDPAAVKAANSSKTLLYIMVAFAIVGNLLIFLYYFTNERANKQNTAAPTTMVVVPAVVPPAEVVQAPPAPAPEPPANVVSAPTVAPVETNAAQAAVSPPAAPEPPKPAPLRLQSVMLSSTKPAALVSGKFVNIGSKVQGSVVIAIDQESVTLVGSDGKTNVLSLP